MQPVIEPAAVADLAQLEPRLGEWLLAEHKLSPADLERALGVQRTMGGRLGQLLVDLGLVLEAALGGQGVALARPSLARRWLADASLVPLFALTAQPAQLYLQLPVAAGASSAALAFSRWLAGVGQAAVAAGQAALQR